MLLHSQTTTVYLNRRSRLFQPIAKPTLTPSPSPATTQQWLITFASQLSSSQISMTAMKQLIGQLPSELLARVAGQLMGLLKLAMVFQPASKISNIVYYLCRAGHGVRAGVIGELDSWCLMLSNSKFYNETYRQKLAIILTDMFLFGIHFTQQKFLTTILANTLKQTPQATPDRAYFQLHYLCHYGQILGLSQLLNPKNHNRVHELAYNLIGSVYEHGLKRMQREMKVELEKLEIQYSKGEKEQSAERVHEREKLYIEKVHCYERMRNRLLRTLVIFKQSGSEFDYEGLAGKIEEECPAVFAEDHQAQLQAKKEGECQVDQDGSSEEVTSETSMEQQQQERQQQAEKQLLKQIHNSCKYFPNSSLFPPNPLYTLTPMTPSPRRPAQTPTYLQLLPQSFLQSLLNCPDIENADTLALQFLQNYNKHCNRAKLVYTIMRDLYDRNNIGVIVRVLAVVWGEERDEVGELVGEVVQGFRECCRGKIGRSQFGRYAQLVIEMIKFGILPAEDYLTRLLCLIKSMHTPLNPLPTLFTQPPTLLQTLSLLQKLSQQLYYQSLPIHILLNKIIDQLNHHIRTKTNSYDMETINRFNGLVRFLRLVRRQEGEGQGQGEERLGAEELRDGGRLRSQVKRLKGEIRDNGVDERGRDGLARVTRLLCHSVQNENHMQSYIYSDLVYQIGSKKLDESIKKAVTNSITQNLKEGNYQGATNWARFYGELHRSRVLDQGQFIGFLEGLVEGFFGLCAAAVVKVICSGFQACSYYMKNTNKISQITQTLTFLLTLKKNLLQKGGLQNTILEHEIEQLFEYFHPAFKYITSVQACIQVENKIKERRDRDAELVMAEYYEERKDGGRREEGQGQDKGCLYKEKEKEKSMFKEKKAVEDIAEEKLDQFEICELETNSSHHVDRPATMPMDNGEQSKPKKLKIVGRSKNSKKIQKIQIMI